MTAWRVFERVAVGSPEWNEAEISLVACLAELKTFRILTRGARKNQIQVLSPGRRGAAEEGGFEWTVGAETFNVLRDLDPSRSDHLWTDLLYPNPLTGPLRQASKELGWRLAQAIAIWNELGSRWPDLWDYYVRGEKDCKPSGWQGFLDLFRTFQRAHLPAGSLTERAIRVVDEMRQGIPRLHRRPFTPTSPLGQVLTCCDVSAANLIALEHQVAEWQALREVWASLRRNPRRQAVVADPDTVSVLAGPTGTTEEALDYLADSVLLGLAVRRKLEEVAATGRSVEFQAKFESNRRLSVQLKILRACGVGFLLEAMKDEGRMDIVLFTIDREVHLGATISLREDLTKDKGRLALVLCHELGHFLEQGHWWAELRLAEHAAAVLTERSLEAAAEFASLKRSVQARLIANHSIIEMAADEFVVDLLLPKRRLLEILAECTSEKGVSVFFYGLAQAELGANDDDFARIWPSVADRTGLKNWGIPLSGMSLRRLCQAVSEQRVEAALDSFWQSALDIIGRFPAARRSGPTSTRTAGSREIPEV